MCLRHEMVPEDIGPAGISLWFVAGESESRNRDASEGHGWETGSGFRRMVGGLVIM